MPDYTLTPGEVAQLQSYASRITDLENTITKFERAGLDASALRANLEKIKAVREGLLREFAPGGSKVQK